MGAALAALERRPASSERRSSVMPSMCRGRRCEPELNELPRYLEQRAVCTAPDLRPSSADLEDVFVQLVGREAPRDAPRMNLARLRAIARKEFLQVWRDPRSLMIALFMPIMQILTARLRREPRYQSTFRSHCSIARQPAQPSAPQTLPSIRVFRYSHTSCDNYGDIVAAIDAGRCKLAHRRSPRLRAAARAGGPSRFRPSSTRPMTTPPTSRSAMPAR